MNDTFALILSTCGDATGAIDEIDLLALGPRTGRFLWDPRQAGGSEIEEQFPRGDRRR